MFVFKFLIMFSLTLTLGASPSQAFTISSAQQCADELLMAYNQKRYPEHLLALDNIITNAYGPNYRSFSNLDKKRAHDVAKEHIKESFTKATGNYRYSNLLVTKVEKTKNGYRVIGEVEVTSPKGNGRYSFLALVKTPGCQVYQVRIADIITMIDELKTELARDVRVNKDLFKL